MKALSFLLALAFIFLAKPSHPAHATVQLLTKKQENIVQNFFPKGVTLFHLAETRKHLKIERRHFSKASQLYFLYSAFSTGNALSFRVSMFSKGYLPNYVRQCSATAKSDPIVVSAHTKNWTLCKEYLYSSDAKQSTVVYLSKSKIKKLYPRGGKALKQALVRELKRYKPQLSRPLQNGSWIKSIQKIHPLDRILAFRSRGYALQSTSLSWSSNQQDIPVLKFAYRNKKAPKENYDVNINLFKQGTRTQTSCDQNSRSTQYQSSTLSHPALGTFDVCKVLQKNRKYYGDPKSAYFYPLNKRFNNTSVQVSFKDQSDVYPPLEPILAKIKKLSNRP